MIKYQEIADEHAHEFNAMQEMRQTQATEDEECQNSSMGSKDIRNLIK